MGKKSIKQTKKLSLPERGYDVYLGSMQTLGRREKVSNITISGGRLHLFGDESSSQEFVTYSLVICDQVNTIKLEEDWSSTLAKYGSSTGRGFHARVILSDHQRLKSQWKDLTTTDINQLVLELATILGRSGAQIYLGVVHKETFPASTLDGWGKEMRILDSQLFALGYTAAATMARDERILSAQVPKHLWIDQDDTARIWGIGNIQIKRLISGFGLKPEKISKIKPLLIEAADLVAYSCGRALDTVPSKNHNLCLKVMAKLNPAFAHYWWNPQNQLNPEIAERLNRCSFLLRDFIADAELLSL